MLISCSNTTSGLSEQPHDGFVDLEKHLANKGGHIQIDLRYFGSDNFVGAPVDGYNAERVYISEQAADALVSVQKSVAGRGLTLKVFDAYRPQRAVDHFVRWAKDIDDRKMKSKYYPNVDKEDLFSAGYITDRSGHSRGSTIDLTLYSLDEGKELDMGTPWDFFDVSSKPSSKAVSESQSANRMILREAMTSAGFNPLAEEWWHFTLSNEPYPDQYFDFEIK